MWQSVLILWLAATNKSMYGKHWSTYIYCQLYCCKWKNTTKVEKKEVTKVLTLSITGNHLCSNLSDLSCNLAVIFSMMNTCFTLSLHSVILGGCGFNQEAVIFFFAIKSRILSKEVKFPSMTLSGTIPNMYNARSRVKSIPKTCFIYF